MPTARRDNPNDHDPGHPRKSNNEVQAKSDWISSSSELSVDRPERRDHPASFAAASAIENNGRRAHPRPGLNPKPKTPSRSRPRWPGHGLLLWSLCLLLPRAAEAAQPADVAALMAKLGQVERVQATYEETVESGLLEIPVGSRGELIYEAPNRIQRISHQGDGFVMEGRALRMIRAGKPVSELDLADIAPLEALMTGLRACFAGDLKTLEQHYRVRYEARAQDWSLTLEPEGAEVSRLLESIALRGVADDIRAIEVVEANQDRRVMRLRVLEREPARID